MLLLFFLMFQGPEVPQRAEIEWSVNTDDGMKSFFEATESVYVKSRITYEDPLHLFFRSYDEVVSGGEVVLTIYTDYSGQHALWGDLDYRRINIFAKDRVESYNDGLLMAHKAEVITEQVAEGRNRPVRVVFTVPTLAGRGWVK